MAREIRLMKWCAAALAAVAFPVAAQGSDAFPLATAKSQGMSTAALEELAGVVRGYVENDVAVGAELIVIKNRHTVLHEAFGWRDREEQEPYELDTICNIRSMTKTLTGAAAQILIDRGLLDLDDPVAKYVPGFDHEDARDITIRQLMTHRSGLPLSVIGFGGAYDSLQAMANEAGERGPQFPPDSKFWYSDAGTDTLGAVVEVVSGQLLDEFVRAEILEPLGMNDSFWLHEEDRNDPERIASLYARVPSGWFRFWQPGNTFVYAFAWGSQSLYSTPTDYAKFLAMWMDEGRAGEKRILSEDAITRTLTPVSRMTNLGSDAPFPSGYEDLVPHYGQMSVLHVDPDAFSDARPVIIGHSGSDGTIGWAWPERDLMILYFTQSRGGASALLLEPYIDYLLLHPERQEESLAHLEPHVGTYTVTGEAELGDAFTILIQNGHLALHIEGRDFPFELAAPDRAGKRSFLLDSQLAVSFPPVAEGERPQLVLHEPGGEQSVFRQVVEPAPLADDVQARLDRLIERLEEQRVQQHIPGMALAVVQGDRPILLHGFGVSDVENETPATPDTVFGIGSATKAFTATLVGMLMDDGMLTWDDPVTKHLPWFELPIDSEDPEAQVTLRDLLSHRTGFTRMSALVRNPDVPHEEILRTALRAEPWAPFRAHWYYSNVMYLAAGTAAAAAAGSDWETLVRKRILGPLYMRDTFTNVPTGEEAKGGFVPGYAWDPVEKTLDRAPLPNVGALPPAGAIHSTARDMARWLRFQLARGSFAGRRLLDQEVHAETWQTQIDVAPGMGYGLGWGVEEWNGQLLIEHGGNVEGYSAHVAMLPESDLGYVLLTNVSVTPLTRLSMDIVFDALLGEEPALPAPVAASNHAPYIGTYRSTLKDELVEVLEKDGHLVFQASLGSFEMREPDDEGRWRFAATDMLSITFERDETGRVAVLNLHQGPMTFECIREGITLAAEVDAPEVDRYLGDYYSEQMHETLVVLVQNGRLGLRIPGQGVFELHPPDEEGRWKFRLNALTGVTFQEDDAGGIATLTYFEGPGTLVYDRVPAEREEALPTLDEVLAPRLTAEYRAAVEALGQYRLVGTVRLVHSGVVGNVTWHAAGTTRHALVQDLGAFGRIRVIVNETHGWTDVPPGIREERHGRFLTQFREGHPAALFTDPRAFFAKVRVLERDELDGRPVFVLEAQNEGMPVNRFFVDAETSDLLAWDRSVISSGGMPPLSLRMRYADHRDFHGLRIPHRITTSHPGMGRIITQIETIEAGLAHYDSPFRLEEPTDR